MEVGLHLSYYEWGKCAMYQCCLFGSHVTCLNLHSQEREQTYNKYPVNIIMRAIEY